MQKFLFIAVAGGLGALTRYALAGIVQRHAGAMFPWGTATVNIMGCMLAGFLWTVATERLGLSGEIRTVVFVGFLGAFTTFSTYILETGNLLRDGAWIPAAGNMVLQNGLGLAALITGAALVRLL